MLRKLGSHVAWTAKNYSYGTLDCKGPYRVLTSLCTEQRKSPYFIFPGGGANQNTLHLEVTSPIWLHNETIKPKRQLTVF